MSLQQEIERDLAEGRAAYNPDGDLYATSSWRPKDLAAILQGNLDVEPPAFLERTDGTALIYPGRAHSFFGPSESLKSWVALLACASVVSQGKPALYVDFEDDAISFVKRARLIGIPDEKLGTALVYARPEEPLIGKRGEPGPALWDLRSAENDLDPALVVIDGVSEAFALHGWDTFSATDTAEYHRILLRGFATAATIEIDHTAKTEGRGQLGSQHKRAGLDGASYEFKPVQPAGRGQHSIVRLLVSKDRHGFVRPEAVDDVIGLFHLDESAGVGSAEVYIAPPTTTEDLADALRDRVGEFIAEHPGSTKAQVRDGVSGSNTRIDGALARLIEDGLVVVTTGPRNSRQHFLAGQEGQGS